jgi:hypothetical protein
MGTVSSPLSKVVGFAIPLISPAVTGHFETNTIVTIVNHPLGVDLVTNYTRIRHTLTLHSASVVALLADTNEVDGFILYVGNLVVVDIGLVITPRGDVDITDVDSRKRLLYLGNISSFDDDSTIVDVTISCTTIESTITFDLPDLEFSIGRYNGEVIVVTVIELSVINNCIVLFDLVRHSVVDY